MRAWVLAWAIALGLVGSTMSSACSYGGGPLFKIDRNISIASDGSFKYAAEIDNGGVFFGNPFVDAGNGRVGQMFRQNGVCSYWERLLFVDCVTKEMILVDGIDNGFGISGGSSRTIKVIQHPYGPIRVDRMTVSEVAAVARAKDYEFTTDVAGEIGKMRKRNRFDPFIGCRIFYPDSIGAAKQE